MTHNPATCPAFGGCNDCRTADAKVGSWDLSELWHEPPAGPEPDYNDTIEAIGADPVDYAGVPAFTAAADATLARAGATYVERGGQYGDSWALQNIVTTYLDVVLDRLGIFGLSLAAKRLLESASIVDVKESRIKNGPWKLDNSDDGINYRAAFSTWHTEYEDAEL